MTGRHGTAAYHLVTKLEIGDEADCWPYTGFITPYGYGQLGEGQAHRVAYEVFIGPIPDGLVLDHECHNLAVERGACDGGPSCLHRRCCNPGHLAAVSEAHNNQAGMKNWTTKTTCRHGHSTAKFRHRTPSGQTYCSECRRIYKNARREALRKRQQLRKAIEVKRIKKEDS